MILFHIIQQPNLTNIFLKTVAASLTAILALLLHPEVQKRAHEELDRVVGKNLPTIKDRPNLPYIDAIFKESFRYDFIKILNPVLHLPYYLLS